MHDIAFPHGIRTQQRDVTLLFADLRGFTELAASLEMVPLVCELAGHVMDSLTDAVNDHAGCVVDYYGDGLLAMWNAPTDQPNHAELACRTGLAMLDTLHAVTQDWSNAIQSDLRLGIGVHTGVVQVGNAGSARQAKYGPRGPNVYVASRIEAATKLIGLPLIATTTTIAQLSDYFATNRICRAQLPGLPQPVDLYGVRRTSNGEDLSAAWQRYDEALRHFEQRQLQDAAEILASCEGKKPEIPWRFLADELQRELGRQQGRRSTDKPRIDAGGVIALPAK